MPWVHTFIDVPATRFDQAAAFWAAVTGWPVGQPWPGHPEFVSLTPPTGTRYLHLQRIEGPPRVHVDLVGDLDVDTRRLEALGATPGGRGNGWSTMTSPAGLPLCVCDPRPPAAGPCRRGGRRGIGAGWPRSRSTPPTGTTTPSSTSGGRRPGGPTSRSGHLSSTASSTAPRAPSSCSSNGSVPTTPASGPGPTSTWPPTTWPPRSPGSRPSGPGGPAQPRLRRPGGSGRPALLRHRRPTGLVSRRVSDPFKTRFGRRFTVGP